MRRVLLLSVLLVGCGDLPTGPSQQQDPELVLPLFTVSVPNGCVSAEALGPQLDIFVTITNGGSRGVESMAAFSHHDNQAGCAATYKHPVPLQFMGGPLSYTPGPQSSGPTHFVWTARYTCGRELVPVSIGIPREGPRIVLSLTVDYGRDCE
jgi:hypothetical protein